MYKTKVRILGDLSTCFADVSQPDGSVAPIPGASTPALTTQSIPASLPTTPVHKMHRHKPKRLGTLSNIYPSSQKSPSKIHTRQDASALLSPDPLVQDPIVASLPYLIVDPSTFNNLTMYETQATLHEMDLLQVQFRFVLCDS